MHRTGAALITLTVAATLTLTAVTPANSAQLAPVRALHRLPAATATPPAPPPPAPAPAVPADTWASWAYLNIPTGHTTTGGQPGTNSTESMIKAGIAVDYLHGLETAGRDPDGRELDLLTRMIRDSDDQAAQTLYLARGGDAATRRIIDGCALTHTTITPNWWSKTQLDAADAARLGACVQTGRLASRRWSDWVLDQMRQVRGEGRFGLVDVDPGAAIKNGWTLRVDDGLWHVNCLGVTDRWAVAVLLRYPGSRGLGYGSTTCTRIADEILPQSR